MCTGNIRTEKICAPGPRSREEIGQSAEWILTGRFTTIDHELETLLQRAGTIAHGQAQEVNKQAHRPRLAGKRDVLSRDLMPSNGEVGIVGCQEGNPVECMCSSARGPCAEVHEVSSFSVLAAGSGLLDPSRELGCRLGRPQFVGDRDQTRRPPSVKRAVARRTCIRAGMLYGHAMDRRPSLSCPPGGVSARARAEDLFVIMHTSYCQAQHVRTVTNAGAEPPSFGRLLATGTESERRHSKSSGHLQTASRGD